MKKNLVGEKLQEKTQQRYDSVEDDLSGGDLGRKKTLLGRLRSFRKNIKRLLTGPSRSRRSKSHAEDERDAFFVSEPTLAMGDEHRHSHHLSGSAINHRLSAQLKKLKSGNLYTNFAEEPYVLGQ